MWLHVPWLVRFGAHGRKVHIETSGVPQCTEEAAKIQVSKWPLLGPFGRTNGYVLGRLVVMSDQQARSKNRCAVPCCCPPPRRTHKLGQIQTLPVGKWEWPPRPATLSAGELAYSSWRAVVCDTIRGVNVSHFGSEACVADRLRSHLRQVVLLVGECASLPSTRGLAIRRSCGSWGVAWPVGAANVGLALFCERGGSHRSGPFQFVLLIGGAVPGRELSNFDFTGPGL